MEKYETLNQLIVALLLWITTNTEYNDPKIIPKVEFLDQKEQVIDIKLTSYGHYLLSVGKFKPVYYGFYDNNILYDKT